jgi:TetR/AcrR family transcriptional regulator, tetracycline repressor protein
MARKRKITREAMLTAAVGIVDREGLDSLSMRRLGEELGVEAMSLYRHVANKAALLDGVHEAVLAEVARPRRTDDWVEDCRWLARSFRRALRAHPNTLPLFATRPAVTRGSLEHLEAALDRLAEPFPEMKRRVHALQVLVTYVVGNTMQLAVDADVDAPDYRNLPRDRFPILSSVGPTLDRYSLEGQFEFGLDALLFGLQALAR